METDLLFLRFFSGFSTVRELAEACPEEFKKANPWSYYALEVYLYGGDISNWKWKGNKAEQQRQTEVCFFKLIYNLDMLAVAGWMLSKMLVKVPEYLPLSV